MVTEMADFSINFYSSRFANPHPDGLNQQKIETIIGEKA